MPPGIHLPPGKITLAKTDTWEEEVKESAASGARCRLELFDPEMSVINTLNAVSAGFVEKEIKKANIPIMDTGENPEVPFPRDMIDLEVMMCEELD